MCADELNKISLTGKVEKRTLGGTSKMAHTGFVLQTRDGAIKLRRNQGNPFYDEFFEKYENKNITVEGYDMDQYFLVTDVK
ncbi:MAG: hypothetical protein E6H06_08425 [Bacteroidetes bacterium]|nr:MAG: hypothetical protein E6H06_08425 [Bacteroidota bacterium]